MKNLIPLTIAAFVFAYLKAASAAYFDPNWSSTVTFDSTPAWPLCGAVQENDPSYQTGGNCPAARHGNAAYADVVDSPYGPRLGDSGHDFHRGLDLLTPNMTNISPPQPVFAVAAGAVDKIESTTNDGWRIRIKHKVGTATVYTRYVHLSSIYAPVYSRWTDGNTTNDGVTKGQLIGYTGLSDGGRHHLHFEVLKGETWQRSTVHPLRVLPFTQPIQAPTMTLSAGGGVAMMHLETTRTDVIGVELQDTFPALPDTQNAEGYYIEPAALRYEIWNYQYSHRGETGTAWPSFGLNGEHECPYHTEHGAGYNTDYHLVDPTFNGFDLVTYHFGSVYTLDVSRAISSSCVQGRVFFADGTSAQTAIECF